MLIAFQIHATTWNVGPTRSYTYCSQVAPLVQHGDTVEIDFATYINDPSGIKTISISSALVVVLAWKQAVLSPTI